MTPDPPPDTGDQPQELDAPGADPPKLAPKGPPFDPTKSTSQVRTVLAFAGFGLFAIVVLLLLIPVTFGIVKWEQVEQAAIVLLPAVTAVTGSVTAFYFATGGSSKGKQ